MARIRNEQEYLEKKLSITKSAIKLLNDIGYDEFSVNKVILNAGLTKGAFFHYFDSKNELINDIIDYFQKPLLENLKEIADDSSIEPIDKIPLMAKSITGSKDENKTIVIELMNLLQKEENIIIGELINERSIKLFIPIYEKVLIEGNKKGQFNIANPIGSLFMYFHVLSAIRKEISHVTNHKNKDQHSLEELNKKIEAFEAFAKELFHLDEDTSIIGPVMTINQ